jgi:hypothetical protein
MKKVPPGEAAHFFSALRMAPKQWPTDKAMRSRKTLYGRKRS